MGRVALGDYTPTGLKIDEILQYSREPFVQSALPDFKKGIRVTLGATVRATRSLIWMPPELSPHKTDDRVV